MKSERRSYGQRRRDKDLAWRANHKAPGKKPRPSELDLLDARICFRASTVQRDLSFQVQKALDLTQGELFRSLLEEKAEQLGLTPMELAR